MYFMKLSLTIDKRIIYYEQYGTDRKTLLLLHGFGIGSGIWNEIPTLLSKKYTVITLDLPGYGLNGELKGYHTLEDQTQFVAEFIKKHDTIHYLAGYSFGGRVSYELTQIQNPPSLDKVVMIGAPFFES